MKQKVILRCAMLAVAAAMLSACGPQGDNLRDSKPELTADSAGARAVNLWQAKIKRNFTAAYPYYTPGYRSTTPLLQFVDNFPGGRVVWNDVEYVDQACEAAKCTVELDVTYSYLNPAPGVESVTNTRRVKETWLLIDGAWYFSP